MPHAYALVVLTLLQLCRAEIPDALPEWYAANLIKDAEYQPKPITEIFTTHATFSSKNPVIVTSTASNSEQGDVFSTRSTSTTPTATMETSSSTEESTRRVIPLRENRPTSSQPLDTPRQGEQQSEQDNSYTSLQGSVSVTFSHEPPRQIFNPTPQEETRQSTSQPFDIPRRSDQPPPQRDNRPSLSQQLDTPRQANEPPLRQESRSSSLPPLDITRQMGQREDRPSSFQPLDIPKQMEKIPSQLENLSPSAQPLDLPRQMYQPPPQQIQVLVAQPQIPPLPQIQTSLQVSAAPIPPSPPAPPVPILPPPQIQLPLQPVNQQQTTGHPNYFLIYQQAPLSIQQYPESAFQSRPNSPSTTQATTRTPETQRTTQEATRPTTAFQPQTSVTNEIQTTSSYVTTSVPTYTRYGEFGFSSTVPPFVATWHDPSTAPGATYYSPPISSTIPPNAPYIPCSNISTGRNPKTAAKPVVPLQQHGQSGLTIRVSAPRGSVTNIKINPSTTTKKPPTHRSQRRKGNNYSNCVDSCRGKKEPLCAAPLAVVPIDPNNLKGFPSICHLACHNSFRKNQPFEKIMDGRCSKLRTRIRTFDKNKLKREELNKAQYTVLNNIPETIVQVIQNERSGLY